MRRESGGKMRSKVDNARNRMIAMIILIFAMVLLLYTLFVSYSVYKQILDNNYENVETAVETTTDTLSQTFEMMRGTTYNLSGSEAIGKWRNDRDYFRGSSKQASLNRQSLNEEIQRLLTYNNTWKFELFDYIAIYENETLLSITYTRPYGTQQIINDTEKLREELSKNEAYTQTILPKNEDGLIYTTLRVQADFHSEDSIYIIGATETDNFDKRLESLVNYDGTIACIVSADGNVLSSSNRKEELEDCGVSPKSFLDESNNENKDYQIIKKKIRDDLYLVHMVPMGEMIKQTFRDMKMILILSIVMAIILMIPASIIIINMTSIFKDLIDAMKRVGKKDYKVRLKSYNNVAYNEVASSFNSMVMKLEELIHTTYESKLLLDQMEIKFLQQQMNPHFLFNILLTIQIKAKMSGDETIYKMISSLSSLLRAGVYGDKRSVITLREEMQYVEYYLNLQQERYEERLQCEIEVEDTSILDCEIPRLVIEPMVENTIVHGVEAMDAELKVKIKLWREEEYIYISVEDNGIGFDIEELKKTKDDVTQREKTGINNTHQRIRLMYGEPYGIKIFSQPMKGTKVLICIPGNKSKKGEEC